MEAMRPTLATRENYQVWMTSSSGFGYSTELRALRDRAEAGDGRRLLYLGWGLEGVDLGSGEDRLAALGDPRNWELANPSLGRLISHEYMEDEFAAFAEVGNYEGFAREHLGVWNLGSGVSALSESDWGACGFVDSEIEGDRVVVCVDMDDGKNVAVCVAGVTVGGGVQVEVVECDVSGDWVASLVSDLVGRWDVLEVVVDGSGPAGALISALQEVGVVVKVLGSRGVAQACAGFAERVGRGGVVHLGDALLNKAVVASARKRVGELWMFNRDVPGVAMAPLVGVAVACDRFARLVGEELVERRLEEEGYSWVW